MSDATINFLANSLPALEAGEYKIQVTQSLGSTGNAIDTKGYFANAVTQTFHVDAPQFLLSAADVGPRLPGPNGIGQFGWVLPQVQLNRKTLPWERPVAADKTVPWMALIVLRDSELILNPATAGSIFNTTVGAIGTVPGDVFWPNPAHNCLQEKPDAPVETIRITPDVFKNVMPRLADLAMLCHVRALHPETGNRQGDTNRAIAMVTANRFPPASNTGRCHCFLVSVEGFKDYLIPSPDFGTKTKVQLAVLAHWSFVSQATDSTAFLNGLRLLTADRLMLRVPVPARVTDKTVRARLTDGFIPAEYAADGQNSSYAWYRGPLTPTVAQPLPVNGTDLPASDGAMIYIQNEGVFDLSYAAAWEMGRALALADADFAMCLLQFRTASYRILSLLMDRLRLSNFTGLADLQAIVGSNAIYNAFDGMINEKIIALLQRISLQAVPPASHPKPAPPNPTPPVVATQNFLQLPAVLELIGQAVAQELIPVAAWLAQLRLLCRVPFSHLVPDQRMLPPNSVRFFYIDQHWLDCVMAGAKSVGVQGSQDTLFFQAMKGVIDDAVAQEMDAYMLNIGGQSTGDHTGNATAREAMSGMLMRSSIVADYPTLTVTATKSDGRVLKVLRKELLSANILLVIWLDVPDQVVVAEPNAGLSMGAPGGSTHLRNRSGGGIGAKTTTAFPGTGNFTQFFRHIDTGSHNSPADNVLNVTDGSASLSDSLRRALGMTAMDSGNLAMQLVLSPDYFTFHNLPPGFHG